MADLLVYGALFLAALATATVLPMQSEAALVSLLLTEECSTTLLVTTASLGNVPGAVFNWFLGRWLERFRGRRWFPASVAALNRAEGWYRRYGRRTLLARWFQIVGDPITVVAGVLKEPLPTLLLLVAIAKVGRYVVLAVATTGMA